MTTNQSIFIKDNFMSSSEPQKEQKLNNTKPSVSDDDESLNLELIRKWEANHPKEKGQPIKDTAS
jgi:hypothetical protein